jgi:hypothetical protein
LQPNSLVYTPYNFFSFGGPKSKNKETITIKVVWLLKRPNNLQEKNKEPLKRDQQNRSFVVSLHIPL